MAVAEEKTSPETTEKSWHGVVLQTLKRNDIRLVPYVPDRVLTHADQEPARRSLLHHLPHRARGGSGRHRLRRLDGRHARRGADADFRICHARKRAGIAGDPLSDPADHVRLRTRHARRIQLWAVAGVPHHASGARSRSRWSTTPRHGSMNSSSSSTAPSSRPSRRRRR